MKKLQIILFSFILLFLFSCKKDNSLNVDLNKQNRSELILKARIWYDQKSENLKQNSSTLKNIGAIDWSRNLIDLENHSFLLEVSLKSNFLKKYLKIVLNSDGSIKNETQVFLVFDRGSEIKINNFLPNKNLFNYNNCSININASILEYSLKGELIRNACFYKGFKIDKLDKLFEEKPSIFSKSTFYNSKQNNSNLDCTAWYWNTYYGGILISSVYVITTCEGEATMEIEGDEGGGGAGSNEEDPNESPNSAADICEKSFEFNRFVQPLNGTGGWQVAGTSNIHMNIVDLTTGEFRYVGLPTMFFGLPVFRINGDYYSVSQAKEIAAAAVNYAESETMLYYHNIHIPGNIFDAVALTLKYREKMNYYMSHNYSGSASLSAGSNINVTNIKIAKYGWPWLGCL